MTADPTVVVEPGPGCCGTITLGATAVLVYRFGAGPLASAGEVAVTLTNQAGPVVGGEGAELWVPQTWTSGSTDEPAARRLPGDAPTFTADVLGGAQVTVLRPELNPAPGIAVAASLDA